jgi:geranylgeranyl reductase family protein
MTGAVDVAIVGAGPSGAWAAYRLVRAGARVTIVDGSHPREKPCGGGVTGRALAEVAEALPASATSLPIVEVRTVRFLDPRGDEPADVSLEVAGMQPLIVASRRDFDSCLLAAARAAGATLLAARALDIRTSSAGFEVVTDRGTVWATQVIGADGANSLVRRRLAHPLPRDQISIATGYFAHGVTSDTIVIAFMSDPPGYFWSFPRPTHLAVGVCAQTDAGATAGDLRARARDWLRSTGLGAGAALEPYAWPIPSLTSGGLIANAVSGPGWSLVGDAAGLVDPITREGIYFAVRSAHLAAEAIADGRGETYAQAVAETITPELTRAARLKAGFFQPRFVGLLVEALRRNGGVRRVMADLVAGRQPYHGLAWRLARTFDVPLACRFLRQSLIRN